MSTRLPLIFDEVDTIFGPKRAAENNEELRGLLNAGFQRGKSALRCVGPSQVPTQFATFAMAALGGIGRLPDTITDRAINIRMRRRKQGETVAPFRERRDRPTLTHIRGQLAKWLSDPDMVAELKSAEPHMDLEDRAADVWESLIAVADLAGGRWPQLAAPPRASSPPTPPRTMRKPTAYDCCMISGKSSSSSRATGWQRKSWCSACVS